MKRRGCQFGWKFRRFTPGYLHSRVERIRVKGSEGAAPRVFEESVWRFVDGALAGMVEEARAGQSGSVSRFWRRAVDGYRSLILIVRLLFPPPGKAQRSASKLTFCGTVQWRKVWDHGGRLG